MAACIWEAPSPARRSIETTPTQKIPLFPGVGRRVGRGTGARKKDGGQRGTSELVGSK